MNPCLISTSCYLFSYFDWNPLLYNYNTLHLLIISINWFKTTLTNFISLRINYSLINPSTLSHLFLSYILKSTSIYNSPYDIHLPSRHKFPPTKKFTNDQCPYASYLLWTSNFFLSYLLSFFITFLSPQNSI